MKAIKTFHFTLPIMCKIDTYTLKLVSIIFLHCGDDGKRGTESLDNFFKDYKATRRSRNEQICVSPTSVL